MHCHFCHSSTGKLHFSQELNADTHIDCLINAMDAIPVQPWWWWVSAPHSSQHDTRAAINELRNVIVAQCTSVIQPKTACKYCKAAGLLSCATKPVAAVPSGLPPGNPVGTSNATP